MKTTPIELVHLEPTPNDLTVVAQDTSNLPGVTKAKTLFDFDSGNQFGVIETIDEIYDNGDIINYRSCKI